MKSFKQNRRRWSTEQLEQRIALDGGGFAGLLLAGLAPDSQLGDDPHVDTVGADASPLEFVGGLHARVDSFIDSAGDIDVFQYDATGEMLRIAGLVVEGQPEVHVIDEAGDNVVGVNAAEPRDGFVQCEWGDFRFCDVFPTSPGETYFVTIGGRRVETTEYYFEFFQTPVVVDPTAVAPDSKPGDDPHPDRVGPDATVLELDAHNSHVMVDSFIDESGDVDVFQFRATSESAHVRALPRAGNLSPRLHVLSSSGEIIASNVNNDGIGVDLASFVDAVTNVGERYFLRVSAREGEFGEYMLEIVHRTSDAEPPTGNPDSPLRNPDSSLGDDVHADEIGADATALVFAPLNSQEIIATVDSYLDEAGDIDAFRFTAHRSSVTISAYSWFDVLDFSIQLYDSSRNLIASSEVHAADPTGAGAFANLSLSLNTREPYYVLVSGAGDAVGEFVLNVFQSHEEQVTLANQAKDSERGDDPHANHIGPDASQLALDESGGAFVNSFIDAVGDVDLFQFTGTGGMALAAAMTVRGRNLMSVRVFDADRMEVESMATVGGLTNAPEISMWSTKVGETYFIEVAARNDMEGQYVLKMFVDTAQDNAVENVDGFNAALAGLPDAPGSHDRLGQIGDANFDGGVDAMDFAIWNQHRFQNVRGPGNGDFNGDGVADVADFNIWNDNRFTRPAAADEDSPSGRVPRAPAGIGLSRPDRSARGDSDSGSESARVVIPVASAVIPAARITNPTTSHGLLSVQDIDFVMAQTSTEEVTSADIREWVGHRRPQRNASTTVSDREAVQRADNCGKEACLELLDKLFSRLGSG